MLGVWVRKHGKAKEIYIYIYIYIYIFFSYFGMFSDYIHDLDFFLVCLVFGC